ncbi:hypothetical protein [Rhizobacter fulvus]
MAAPAAPPASHRLRRLYRLPSIQPQGDHFIASLFLACVLGLFLGIGRWLFPVALVAALLVCPLLALPLILVAGGVALFNRKDH